MYYSYVNIFVRIAVIGKDLHFYVSFHSNYKIGVILLLLAFLRYFEPILKMSLYVPLIIELTIEFRAITLWCGNLSYAKLYGRLICIQNSSSQKFFWWKIDFVCYRNVRIGNYFKILCAQVIFWCVMIYYGLVRNTFWLPTSNSRWKFK